MAAAKRLARAAEENLGEAAMSEVVQEANRIKERLRACTTAEEVKQVSDDERDLVMSWNPKGLKPQDLAKELSKSPDTRALMHLHIVYLKVFLIRGFEKREQGRAA
ncbi:hypothetical protein [Phaeobacter gallaeciensis]|uniref:hypothetical protein n=1 Tax=Phaeobacter gallaeciensis TaxID=60890 RepID=UPI00237F73D7|nr:hypothetical protein [Phaeobacter gallaeciensis]MDE4189644.1 hypothetical protein [Phaeobacter gallaeciensis]MDE4198796.1 hypothetical protein [Phaeobacter gallaeciensis]MDE4202942.1 hypothetical protein [Phaeobacter gallaeciensis]MDE4207085.1 hypothetical protein [Phaeobacter gallaeciensis]MDE4215690.1 hypothetical protein [Phaeobacter gallaeciensis]